MNCIFELDSVPIANGKLYELKQILDECVVAAANKTINKVFVEEAYESLGIALFYNGSYRYDNLT